jgi:hypothetical protein
MVTIKDTFSRAEPLKTESIKIYGIGIRNSCLKFLIAWSALIDSPSPRNRDGRKYIYNFERLHETKDLPASPNANRTRALALMVMEAQSGTVSLCVRSKHQRPYPWATSSAYGSFSAFFWDLRSSHNSLKVAVASLVSAWPGIRDGRNNHFRKGILVPRFLAVMVVGKRGSCSG